MRTVARLSSGTGSDLAWATLAPHEMSQSKANITCWAIALGVGWLLAGCTLAAHRPWVQIARQATGDGLSPDTAARFGSMPADPMLFIRSEWAWLELHGYTRIDEQQVKGLFVPTRRGFLSLHVWPVRDAAGRAHTIYFDKTPMVGPPIVARKQQ